MLKRQRIFLKGISAILLLLIFSGASNVTADQGNWIPVYPLIPVGQEVEHRLTTPIQKFTASSRWEDREPVTHERLELEGTPFATPTQMVGQFEDTTAIQVVHEFKDTTPTTFVSHVGASASGAEVRLTSSDDFYAQYEQGEIAYISTSGVEEGCQFHKDCYTSREPKEWCQLMKETHYS
ncbi:abundant larval transcript 2 (alt2) protein [Trichuris trichiura]|uniref:Abundant larval transcript 2 (Alt2) protein n=1 Tax=Trichuris trichiura TaxID=36087 RepID=A0A077YY61_TRITR|nr:abundant larval transcript 2 (alt2) protein [Trichuris trichiura]